MDSQDLKPNELKLVTFLLSNLEKRIYLLRVSLYGDVDKYCSGNSLLSKEALQLMENKDFETIYKLSAEDYRIMVDCCDIEAAIQRILSDLKNKKSYNALKEIIKELESETTEFKKHKKMMEAKQKELEQLKQELLVVKEEAKAGVKPLKSQKIRTQRKFAENIETIGDLGFLRKLMDCKMKSETDYYEHKQEEIQNEIQWYEKETIMQAHADVQALSFWLLKYHECTQKVDTQLRQMFNNWSEKRRQLEILKKYRRLNLERIQKFEELISERDEHIERYRREREIEKKREELERFTAATKIQAYWRGATVRKHLKERKIEKKKKKGKKGKAKKRK